MKELSRREMNVSIYNHQLCVIPSEVWPFARKSISDWKNEYLDVCDECAVKQRCGGFFSSAKIHRSAHIAPIKGANEDVLPAIANVDKYRRELCRWESNAMEYKQEDVVPTIGKRAFTNMG